MHFVTKGNTSNYYVNVYKVFNNDVNISIMMFTFGKTSLQSRVVPYVMETGMSVPIRELLLTRKTTLPLIITGKARRNGPEGTGSRTALYDGRTTMSNVILSAPILFVTLTTIVYASFLATAVQVIPTLTTSISMPDGADTRIHVNGLVPCWQQNKHADVSI